MTIPEFLFSHLKEAAGTKNKDVTLQFQDGSLSADLILFRATSSLIRSIDSDFKTIVIESSVRSGQCLLDLIYTGETFFKTDQDKLEITELIDMFVLNVNFLIENKEVVCEKTCEFETSLIVNEKTEVQEVNQIIMSNMNQNKSNIVVTQHKEVLDKVKKIAPKDKNKKVYYCDFHPCVLENISFEGISKFKRHTHNVHTSKPLACPENKNGCTFRADDYSKLGNHLQGVHKDKYSLNIVCEECHKAFPSQSYLKTHMQRMHRAGRSDRGKICPYCGETKLQLNDHIMRAHRTQHFQCQYCPKKFKTSVQMRIHNNVHTGFRPYTCLNCDARFSRLHHRKTHLEKHGHTAGPVLKPDDHVDARSLRGAARRAGAVVEEAEVLEEPSHEEISQAITVNCAEIIQNITIGAEELEF